MSTDCRLFRGATESGQVLCALAVGVLVCGCESRVENPGGPSNEANPVDAHPYEVIERLTSAPCMPELLVTDPSGHLPCIVAEARHAEPCVCDPTTGRVPLVDALVTEFIRSDELASAQGLECLCEIAQLEDEYGQYHCLYDTAPDPPVHGWCFIDAEVDPPQGDGQFVAQCPDGRRQTIRFVGDAEIAPGTIVYLGCPTDMEAAAYDAYQE